MARVSRLPVLALALPVTLAADEQHARWLSNTFRIDPSITEITLVIEREPASAPVVLIRPDGSKYYYQRHPDHISWASTASRDLITLWQPMPGPWQATGSISEQRGITLVSPFRLEVDALPSRVFQHERIKLNAELRQDDVTLDANYYLDGLSLSARLLPRRQGEGEGFELAPLAVGTFADDGTGLDEYPGDGKMTAELAFNALPGNYLFQAQASNQVLARSHEQEVLVYPMPLSLRFTVPDKADRWQLLIEADSALQADSLVINGELTNPLEQKVAVSGQGSRIALPDALHPGNYRWRGRAFATTQDGREVQLNLAEQVIRVAPPVSAPALPGDLGAPPFWQRWPVLAAAATLLLLLLSGAGFWWRKNTAKKVKK